MGWAKSDEDIREIIDNRMRDNRRSYYGNTYINRQPEYISRQAINSIYHNQYSTRNTSTSTYRSQNSSYSNNVKKTHFKPTSIVFTRPEPPKVKIGYILRNYEHNGVEIYFYRRPDKSVLDKLKDNYWQWHNKKKCWYRRFSEANYKFAEDIIEQ